MKKNYISIFSITTLILILLTSCSYNETQNSETINNSSETNQLDNNNSIENDFGAKGALSDDSFTLEEMLTYAIEDEFMAKYEYEKIIEEFGSQKPFSNIVKSEEQHIEKLIPLFESYNIDVPDDNAAEHVLIPKSILEAGEIGVQAEIDNIAMYEAFLKTDLPDDVKEVFIDLRDASKNHLKSFENIVAREN
jgi:hypothetical protein